MEMVYQNNRNRTSVSCCYWQEKAGAARYAITDRDNNEFLIFDVESALKSKPIANWEHRAHPLGNQYYVGDL